MDFLQSLFDHLLEGVIAYNTSGHIVYSNSSAQKILKNAEDLSHQQIITLFPKDLLTQENDSLVIPFQNGAIHFQSLGDPSAPWPNSAARSLELPDGEKIYLLFFTFKSLWHIPQHPTDIAELTELYKNQIAYTKGLEGFFILSDEKIVDYNTLGVICKRMNASRVYAQTYNPELKRFCTAYEYLPPKVSPLPEGSGISLNKENSLFLKTLEEQGYVFIPDTSDLRDPVHKEIVSLTKPTLDARSLYFIKLHIKGQMWGYVVVSYENAVHPLNSYEKSFLKECIYFLSIGLEQLKTKKWFEKREKVTNMLIMNTPVPLALWDKNGRFQHCNQAYCDCMHQTIEEMYQHDGTRGEIFDEAHAVSAEAYPVAEVVNGKKTFSSTWKLHGREWIFTAQGAYDEQGNLVNILESAMDITAKNQKIAQQKVINKCMEEIFLHNKASGEALPNVIKIIVEYFHADVGYLKEFKENGAEITASAGNPEHLALITSYQNKITPQFYEELAERLDSKKVLLLTPDGKFLSNPCWDDIFRKSQVKTVMLASLHIHGVLWGYITLSFLKEKNHISDDEMDIFRTFQYALEIILSRNNLLASLEKERDNALAAEKAKSFFFATVSHDIRTPLNAIIGLSELLKLGGNDPETQNLYLESIIMSGKTLMQLINDVLDLAKLEAGKMDIRKEMTSCGKIINGLNLAFASEIQRRNISLNCKAEGMPLLNIDPQRIRQILFNLIGNACKFTKQGGITVEARFEKTQPDHGTLTISVKDTGIGISEENQKKLLKPFVQVSDGNITEGTGLGLSICNQLLKKMNGEMRIQSELGKGSDFTIIVRDVEYSEKELVPDIVETSENKQTLDARDLNILMVDDVKLNLQVLSAMCKRLGVEKMASALSGQEALDLLDKGSFNLVLADLWMPEMDGQELTKRIHSDKRFKSLPIYVVTADVEVQKTYSQMGFDGVLLKPITIDQFSALMRDINQKRNGNC